MRTCATLLFVLLAITACETRQPAADLTSTSEPESTVSAAVAHQPTASPTETPAVPPESTPTSTPDSTPTLAPQPTVSTSPNEEVIWNGLVVEAEDRCSPYDSDDYRYSQSVEQRIVAEMGGIIYGPYTGTYFSSTRETDIEHIVARSEAHDSGLCAADDARRNQFASDLLNLTLASPSVNRHQKTDNDVAEWLPDLNRCWFVDRVIQVRQKYGLTIDQREVDAIEAVLSNCISFELVVLTATAQASPTASATSAPSSDSQVDALAMWDDNGNGRITCAEARSHGITPVHRGHPAYDYMDDRDNDGVVCE